MYKDHKNSAASVPPLCTRTHYKHFCRLCLTLMYKDPLQALLLPLSYPYVQGPTTSTSAASVSPLCTRTHYKHFCCLCPTLIYKDPLQALLPSLSYPYVQGPTTSTSAASILSSCASSLLSYQTSGTLQGRYAHSRNICSLRGPHVSHSWPTTYSTQHTQHRHRIYIHAYMHTHIHTYIHTKLHS